MALILQGLIYKVRLYLHNYLHLFLVFGIFATIYRYIVWGILSRGILSKARGNFVQREGKFVLEPYCTFSLLGELSTNFGLLYKEF